MAKDYEDLNDRDKAIWGYLDEYFRGEFAYKGESLYTRFYGEGYLDHALAAGYFVASSYSDVNGQTSQLVLEMAAAVILHAGVDFDFKIELEKEPYAYLVIVCDELQCWDRFSPARDIIPAVSLEIEPNGDLINAKLPFNYEAIKELEKVFDTKLKGWREILEIHQTCPSY